MDKNRMQELAGITQLNEAVSGLSKGEVTGLSEIIQGTLDSMDDASSSEYMFWINILHKIGAPMAADDWEKSLRKEGKVK